MSNLNDFSVIALNIAEGKEDSRLFVCSFLYLFTYKKLLHCLAAEKQKKSSKKPESKKSKQVSPKKEAGMPGVPSPGPSQSVPTSKPKRYSSQRQQRTTQQMPVSMQQAMMSQMGAVYPDPAYFEQLGEFRLHTVLTRFNKYSYWEYLVAAYGRWSFYKLELNHRESFTRRGPDRSTSWKMIYSIQFLSCNMSSTMLSLKVILTL